jgi:hypothetical protein
MSLKKRGLQVLVVAATVILVPTIAMAATGTFTSSTGQAAVRAVNSSTAVGATALLGQATGGGTATRFGVNGTATGHNGVGVQGTGAKWGVFSNGPLGVAPGKSLTCTGCVTSTDMTLQAGQTESGVFAAGEYASDPADFLGVGITYPRPLAAAIPKVHMIDTYGGASAYCPGPGHAARGYLCLYPSGGTYYEVDPTTDFYTYSFGVEIYWTPTNNDPYVGGVWTLTAP